MCVCVCARVRVDVFGFLVDVFSNSLTVLYVSLYAPLLPSPTISHTQYGMEHLRDSLRFKAVVKDVLTGMLPCACSHVHVRSHIPLLTAITI